MRMPVLPVVFLLAAAAAGAAPAPVRVLHYDAVFDTGQYAALCVVPEIVKKSGARFVCYYRLPGQGIGRDDTDGSGALQKVQAPDPNFSVWLKSRLPAVGGCGLAVIATEREFPTKELLVTCPDLEYVEGSLVSTKAGTFIADVHKAVLESLAKTGTAPAPAPPVIVPAPAPAPMVTPRTEPPVDPTTSDVTTAGLTDTVTDTVTDTGPPPPSPAPVPQPVAPPVDWTATGLLVLITILVAALALERLSQILQRRRFLKHALTDDDVVRGAANVEQAAVLLQQQRDDARLRLDGTKRKLADAEAALHDVDRILDLGKDGDRVGHLAALLKYQNELLRLAGGADTPVKAIATIDEKLKERTAIETLLRDRTTNVLEYVRESNALVTACANAFWSHAKSPFDVRLAADDIASAVQRMYAAVPGGGSHDVSAGAMLAAIEQALRKLPEQQQLIDEQKRTLGAVRGFFAEEWPDVVVGELPATVSLVAARMRNARAAAERVHVSERDADAVVTALAALVERERNASRDAQEILGRLREYLALPDRDAETLNTVIRAEAGTPQRVLRLVVAAALPVARSIVASLPADDDLRVVRMLHLPQIADELDTFLGRLWTYQGNQLWDIGIESGFAQNWLHHLFRAEAVLQTYFMSSRLADLGDALAAIAWAFRYATAVSGYEVDRVQLLAGLPAQMDPAYESAREFRLCPDIRSRVQAVLRTQRDGGFAVDVDSVGLRNGGKVLKRGALVLANRHDWEG